MSDVDRELLRGLPNINYSLQYVNDFGIFCRTSSSIRSFKRLISVPSKSQNTILKIVGISNISYDMYPLLLERSLILVSNIEIPCLFECFQSSRGSPETNYEIPFRSEDVVFSCSRDMISQMIGMPLNLISPNRRILDALGIK